MQASFHVEGSEDLLPLHAMPAAVRVCGKLAVLDNVLSKLLAAKHKVCKFWDLPLPHSHAAHTVVTLTSSLYPMLRQGLAEHQGSSMTVSLCGREY